MATERIAVPRAAVSSAPPADVDWAVAFGAPEIQAFAKVFRVHGDRFEASCARLHHGEFLSNGVAHSFGRPGAVCWTNSVLADPAYTRWHHDLSFFAYAIPLISSDAGEGVRTVAAMVRALDSQLTGDPTELRRFHWSPIAVATRSLALATALADVPSETFAERESDIAAIGAHVWRCADVLSLSVERYLGFNHAATTEAGLAVSLLVQGRTVEARESLLELVKVLERGTLSDGMWAERSPAYHIYMLVLVDALVAVFCPDSCEGNRLRNLSRKMHAALAAVVHPDGEIAILNDSGISDAPVPAAVGWKPADVPSEVVLPEAGLARIARGNTTVIMDAGPMGPDAALGHGHADFLSIEVSIGANRLFVDPGVASISSGDQRAWTRSAASHNGPTLRGCEPAEFFGAWRVGRRGTAWFSGFEANAEREVVLRGECDGYLPWGVTVSRTVALEGGGRLTVEDSWSTETKQEAVVNFLVSGEWSVCRDGERKLLLYHQDGERVSVDFLQGRLNAVDSSQYFQEGPMSKLVGTRIEVCPTDLRMTMAVQQL